MAKKKLTTKKPLVGNRRSHAMNATKHAQRPNYQTYTIDGEKIVTTAREARSARKEPRARKCDKKEAA
jgi:ribosomal protein L28